MPQASCSLLALLIWPIHLHKSLLVIYFLIFVLLYAMSTPKISLRISTPADADSQQQEQQVEATGQGVQTHDVASAPGKEKEREPHYGGEIANISVPVDSGGKSGSVNTVDEWTRLTRLFMKNRRPLLATPPRQRRLQKRHQHRNPNGQRLPSYTISQPPTSLPRPTLSSSLRIHHGSLSPLSTRSSVAPCPSSSRQETGARRQACTRTIEILWSTHIG